MELIDDAAERWRRDERAEADEERVCWGVGPVLPTLTAEGCEGSE